MKGHLRLSGGRRLKSPIGLTTRPTSSRVREAVMNILASRLSRCNWLDLCSGSGIMSCEALQRGAKKVVAIERDHKTAKICHSNLMAINNELKQLQRVEVICDDVVEWLKKGCLFKKMRHELLNQDPRFDIVYFDPPYNSKLYSSVLKNLLKGNWLKKNSIVIYEHSAKEQIEASCEWSQKDSRSYGTSSLLFISPQENHLCDIDSMLRQTSQE